MSSLFCRDRRRASFQPVRLGRRLGFENLENRALLSGMPSLFGSPVEMGPIQEPTALQAPAIPGGIEADFAPLRTAATSSINPLVAGGIVTGSIQVPQQIDLYTFETNRNNEWVEIIAEYTTGGPNLRVTVFDAAHTVVRQFSSGRNERFELSNAGRYYVQVHDSLFWSTGSYKIGFERISPPSPNARSLGHGRVFSGVIQETLQKDQYLIQTASNNETVELTAYYTTGGPNLRVTVFDAYGAVVREFGGQVALQRFTLTEHGQYLVQVQDSLLSSTGSYKIGFQRIDPPGPNMESLAGLTSNGAWWVAKSTGEQFANEPWGKWSNTTTWDHVLVGDFSGDGFDDIAGLTSNGDWWLARSTGSGFVNERWGRWSSAAGWTDVLVGDFNGDGRLDIAGRTSSGDWWIARSTGSGFVNERWGRWSAAAGWTDVLVGDFNKDGKTDIAGRTSSGAWWVAQSKGDRFDNQHWGRWSTTAGWTDVQAGDFTGDGSMDIAGRTSSGDWWVAQSTGSSFINQRWGRWSSATAWTDVMVADFNGDGNTDLVGRTSNGDWWIAQSTGTSFDNQRWGRWSTTAGWTDVQTGDFNGDGKMDIVGRTSGGDWWIAQSTGTSFDNQRWGRWSASIGWNQVLAGRFAFEVRQG